MPTGGSLESQGGGTTATRSAMATRVTRTAVPCRVNSQIGATAGPRLVSIGPVVSRAPVICNGTHSGQGDPVASAFRSDSAFCAENSRTVLVAVSYTHLR